MIGSFETLTDFLNSKDLKFKEGFSAQVPGEVKLLEDLANNKDITSIANNDQTIEENSSITKEKTMLSLNKGLTSLNNIPLEGKSGYSAIQSFRFNLLTFFGI